MRKHLKPPENDWRMNRTWCGIWIPWSPRLVVVTDPLEATCKVCLRALERDMDTDRLDSSEKLRARGRAMSRLRDEHREDFERYRREAEQDILAERTVSA